MKNKIVKFIGYSGSGKTTLIEKIVKILNSNNVRVAAIKHDVHGLDIDKVGKDSYRYSEAGAKISIVSSPEMTVFKYHNNFSLKEIVDKINDVDLIIIEGYRSEDNIPTIVVGRKETSKGFKNLDNDDKNIVALVSDYTEDEINDIIKNNDDLKHFNVNDDIDDIIEYIKNL